MEDREQYLVTITRTFIHPQIVDEEPVLTEDRQIPVYLPTEAQAMQISRAVAMIQRQPDGANIVMPMVRVLDVLMALMVNIDDRNWVDDGMTEGEIGVDAMTRIMNELVTSLSPDQDEAPTAKKRVTAKHVPIKSAPRGRR